MIYQFPKLLALNIALPEIKPSGHGSLGDIPDTDCNTQPTMNAQLTALTELMTMVMKKMFKNESCVPFICPLEMVNEVEASMRFLCTCIENSDK